MESHVARRSKWIRSSEWALWFNAISAVFGGGYLLGGAEGMPMWFLENTPFSSFIVPGLILLFIVGGASLIAATARIRQWSTRYLLTFIAGATLLGWITMEFMLIPQGWLPQLVYAAVAVPMLVGGWIGWRSTPHATRDSHIRSSLNGLRPTFQNSPEARSS